MPGVQGCFIDSLAEHCEEIICFLHSPRLDEVDWMDYKIRATNVSLVNIGLHASVMYRTLKSGSFTSHLRNYSSELDALLLRGPSPLLPFMASSSLAPTVLLLVGDYVKGVDDLPQPRWRKEAIRLWSYWNKWMQNRVVSRSLTFVNSQVLYNELKDKAHDLIETRTTSLNKDNFYIREDTCQSKLIRLLYIGRIDRTKGLLQMVEAVAILVERGEDVILNLVGWPEHNDPVLKDIVNLAGLKNVQERIQYLGVKPLGPDLFDCYKQADIFVIASFFEGFPRVIWEAMAHCLPVIATSVGSIPAFISGAAELIPPRESMALADAISRLIHQPDLRKKLIIEGLKLAKANILEVQSKLMISKIQHWLDIVNHADGIE
jgi:glycosyltransferase involved in cell wall biosynthesis